MVYSLTYQKKESLFKTVAYDWNGIQEQAWFTWEIRTQGLDTWFMVQDDIYLTEDNDNSVNIGENDIISLWDTEENLETNYDTTSSELIKPSNSVSLTSSNHNVLPGTTEYFGTLDIVSILGEYPKYTLQDSKWNYFAYYGNHLNFVQTVQTLGGNVYEMVTEREILQNQLFGDRVSYINLSMFKDVRVLMVIEIDGDIWLLQIPADQYHQSKDYLKSLFIQ